MSEPALVLALGSAVVDERCEASLNETAEGPLIETALKSKLCQLHVDACSSRVQNFSAGSTGFSWSAELNRNQARRAEQEPSSTPALAALKGPRLPMPPPVRREPMKLEPEKLLQQSPFPVRGMARAPRPDAHAAALPHLACYTGGTRSERLGGRVRSWPTSTYWMRE